MNAVRDARREGVRDDVRVAVVDAENERERRVLPADRVEEVEALPVRQGLGREDTVELGAAEPVEPLARGRGGIDRETVVRAFDRGRGIPRSRRPVVDDEERDRPVRR